MGAALFLVEAPASGANVHQHRVDRKGPRNYIQGAAFVGVRQMANAAIGAAWPKPRRRSRAKSSSGGA